MIDVIPSGQACGAQIRGVDLSAPLDAATIAEIKQAWWQHHVIAFPDQHLSHADQERVTQYFGVFGPEPFFVPMDGSEHIVAVCRRADEKAPVFALTWHTDWSFQDNPPIGTCLYSRVIPPIGGDTSYANLQMACAAMSGEMRNRFGDLQAIHSARGAYSPEGTYGKKDEGSDRSMKIRTSREAYDTRVHPLISNHPDSGNETFIGCPGYIIGFEGVPEDETGELLAELYRWQGREEFQYTHKWQEDMLVLWDNRSVMHKANGGYDGHARELHRTTIYRPEGFMNQETSNA